MQPPKIMGKVSNRPLKDLILGQDIFAVLNTALIKVGLININALSSFFFKIGKLGMGTSHKLLLGS